MNEINHELKAEVADYIADRPFTVEFVVAPEPPHTKIIFYISKEQSEDLLDAFLEEHYNKQKELLKLLEKYQDPEEMAKEAGCSVFELRKKLKDYGII